MGSPADWVEGIGPDDAAVDVARRVVSQRFDVVWHSLPLAAKNHQEDIEYVHQLRVGTRRAGAAARLFRNLAKKKHIRQLGKELKQIRGAAGAARDLDVICLSLQQRSGNGSEDGLAQAIEYATQRRSEVQAPLIKIHRWCKRHGWKRRVRKLARPKAWLRPDPSVPFRHVACNALQAVVDDFFAYAATRPTEWAELHQLRIRMKKLRYTVEIVAGALDESLKHEAYPGILEIHERLGEINDHVTAAGLFGDWSEDGKGQASAQVFRDLIAEEQRDGESARIAFLDWWSPERCEDHRQQIQTTLDQSTSAGPTDQRVNEPRKNAARDDRSDATITN